MQVALAKPQQVGLNLGVLADDTDFETWSDMVRSAMYMMHGHRLKGFC